jgi:hypothetical protein
MIRCDLCKAGWVPNATGWSDPCVWCNGTGELTFVAVAKICRVDVSTLKRILRPKGRVRVKTAQKILDRLLPIIRPKQSEMFR